tara:strand:+ start:374 stop:1000 length:627 start_codon:yes stop_codon:yes gene_type:complete
MKSFVSLLLVTSLLSSVYAADDPIEVAESVRFDRGGKIGGEDWFIARIKIKANQNKSPEANDPKFLDNIKLKFYVALETKNKKLMTGKKASYRVFQSEVDIVSIRTEEPYHYVSFGIPGVIIERDKLDRSPKIYLVELSVNNQLIPVSKSHNGKGMDGLKSPTAISSFKAMASQQESANKDLMMPQYLLPSGTAKIEKKPVFLRKDYR